MVAVKNGKEIPVGRTTGRTKAEAINNMLLSQKINAVFVMSKKVPEKMPFFLIDKDSKRSYFYIVLI